jgi:protein SCO1/2
VADQLLLYCYQYDPQTGRYSASILNVVRLAGALTVLGLGAFILTATRKRRPRPATAPAATPGER